MVSIANASSIQTVILAGGLGTRIRPLTLQVPKSMVLVNGKPFVHHQLDWLSQCGVTEIVFCIGYLGKQIQDYVGNGELWKIQVRYVDEGSELRGTGGALRLVFDQGLLNENFLVTYGDSYLPISFKEVFQHFIINSEASALMTIFRNEGKWDVSNVKFDGKRIHLYDKKAKSPILDEMKFIDYGLSAFRSKTVETQIPNSEKSDLSDVFHQLSLNGKLDGFEVQQRFYEVGSHSGIEDLERFLEYQQRKR